MTTKQSNSSRKPLLCSQPDCSQVTCKLMQLGNIKMPAYPAECAQLPRNNNSCFHTTLNDAK